MYTHTYTYTYTYIHIYIGLSRHSDHIRRRFQPAAGPAGHGWVLNLNPEH